MNGGGISSVASLPEKRLNERERDVGSKELQYLGAIYSWPIDSELFIVILIVVHVHFELLLFFLLLMTTVIVLIAFIIIHGESEMSRETRVHFRASNESQLSPTALLCAVALTHEKLIVRQASIYVRKTFISSVFRVSERNLENAFVHVAKTGCGFPFSFSKSSREWLRLAIVAIEL
jgi:hypothetical protein